MGPQVEFSSSLSKTDTIPALLSDGEYVINKEASSKLGKKALDYINKHGRVPAFADGGAVTSVALSGTQQSNSLESLVNQLEKVLKNTTLKAELADRTVTIEDNVELDADKAVQALSSALEDKLTGIKVEAELKDGIDTSSITAAIVDALNKASVGASVDKDKLADTLDRLNKQILDLGSKTVDLDSSLSGVVSETTLLKNDTRRLSTVIDRLDRDIHRVQDDVAARDTSIQLQDAKLENVRRNLEREIEVIKTKLYRG
jgi:regulator of replication initiation timing